MTIESIRRAREIREATKDMTREDLSKRAEKIIENMQKDAQYQGLWEAIGRLHILALVMRSDGYMNEKIYGGESKEMYDLKWVAKGKNPVYVGYRTEIKEEK